MSPKNQERFLKRFYSGPPPPKPKSVTSKNEELTLPLRARTARKPHQQKRPAAEKTNPDGIGSRKNKAAKDPLDESSLDIKLERRRHNFADHTSSDEENNKTPKRETNNRSKGIHISNQNITPNIKESKRRDDAKSFRNSINKPSRKGKNSSSSKNNNAKIPGDSSDTALKNVPKSSYVDEDSDFGDGNDKPTIFGVFTPRTSLTRPNLHDETSNIIRSKFSGDPTSKHFSMSGLEDNDTDESIIGDDLQVDQEVEFSENKMEIGKIGQQQSKETPKGKQRSTKSGRPVVTPKRYSELKLYRN